MQNTTNIQETNGRSVTVALPKRFSPRFIGKLIKMQADYRRAFTGAWIETQRRKGHRGG